MIGTSIFLLPNGTFFVELAGGRDHLFLMTKYILPPLNKAMEARQEKIRQSSRRRTPQGRGGRGR